MACKDAMGLSRDEKAVSVILKKPRQLFTLRLNQTLVKLLWVHNKKHRFQSIRWKSEIHFLFPLQICSFTRHTRVYLMHLCGRAVACSDTRLTVIPQMYRWVLQRELKMRRTTDRYVTGSRECFSTQHSHLLCLYSSNAVSSTAAQQSHHCHSAVIAAVPATVLKPSQQSINKKRHKSSFDI